MKNKAVAITFFICAACVAIHALIWMGIAAATFLAPKQDAAGPDGNA